jgi:hypothetical protein
MALTATLDKPTYAPGAKVTLTVVRDVPAQPVTVTVKGGSGATATASMNLIESLTVSDTGNHVWTPGPDDGTTAIYTTTA